MTFPPNSDLFPSQQHGNSPAHMHDSPSVSSLIPCPSPVSFSSFMTATFPNPSPSRSYSASPTQHSSETVFAAQGVSPPTPDLSVQPLTTRQPRPLLRHSAEIIVATHDLPLPAPDLPEQSLTTRRPRSLLNQRAPVPLGTRKAQRYTQLQCDLPSYLPGSRKGPSRISHRSHRPIVDMNRFNTSSVRVQAALYLQKSFRERVETRLQAAVLIGDQWSSPCRAEETQPAGSRSLGELLADMLGVKRTSLRMVFWQTEAQEQAPVHTALLLCIATESPGNAKHAASSLGRQTNSGNLLRKLHQLAEKSAHATMSKDAISAELAECACAGRYLVARVDFSSSSGMQAPGSQERMAQAHFMAITGAGHNSQQGQPHYRAPSLEGGDSAAPQV